MYFAIRRLARVAGLCGPLALAATMPSMASEWPTCIVPPLDPMPAVSSGYGPRALGWHAGIDLPAVTGTPVHAVAPGAIARASRHPAFGLVVVQRLGPGSRADLGVYALYGHLDHVLVAAGDVVSAGTVIGAVGNTGRSTGPHLHFSILQDVPDARLRGRGALGVRERDYAIDPAGVSGCSGR